MVSRLEVRDGIEMLYGEISEEQLYFDFPVWKQMTEAYQPDSTVLGNVPVMKNSYQIMVFLGTWCSDSELQVPFFFSVMDELKDKISFDLQMWAVDRRKKLKNDIPQRYGIKRVPTFIFELEGQEIGRIVESPQTTMEKDIVNIIFEK
jgi:hypothetical protein